MANIFPTGLAVKLDLALAFLSLCFNLLIAIGIQMIPYEIPDYIRMWVFWSVIALMIVLIYVFVLLVYKNYQEENKEASIPPWLTASYHKIFTVVIWGFISSILFGFIVAETGIADPPSLPSIKPQISAEHKEGTVKRVILDKSPAEVIGGDGDLSTYRGLWIEATGPIEYVLVTPGTSSTVKISIIVEWDDEGIYADKTVKFEIDANIWKSKRRQIAAVKTLEVIGKIKRVESASMTIENVEI